MPEMSGVLHDERRWASWKRLSRNAEQVAAAESGLRSVSFVGMLLPALLW